MERKVRDAMVVVFSLYSLNEREESYNDIAWPEVLSLSWKYNNNMIDKNRKGKRNGLLELTNYVYVIRLVIKKKNHGT